MHFLQILLLGIVQGAAELLPVSSSAHVIVVEKLMGLDPSAPELTFLLVMLHTGTMFAVIVYYWKAWAEHYFRSFEVFQQTAIRVAIATLVTVIVGLAVKWIIEKVFLRGEAKAEIESLFSMLPLIAAALFSVGILILIAGKFEDRSSQDRQISPALAAWIGLVQALCLPFRGFSRSGATISAGMLAGIGKERCEEFSFALAVVLTPLVVGQELLRLLKSHQISSASQVVQLAKPGLLGMVCSFGAGLFALTLLSKLLQGGRWKYFGYYCIAASAVVFLMWKLGF